MGWVAVIACYRTSATLLAHVPEPIVLLGGRAGWRLMGWVAVFACYRTSATLLAHVPEPIVLHGGRAGPSSSPDEFHSAASSARARPA